jgi:D-3-phosphoglycerate dehydrogenase / 2-oxoglutarate reductase
VSKNVLLLEGVHPIAKEIFEQSGWTVELRKEALEGVELLEALGQAQVVGIRSKTQLTKEVLTASPGLEAIGAFCIGTNQIDLQAATQLSLPVFNAPFSNSRSVVEMVIGEIICLLRQLTAQNARMHAHQWQKTARGAYELRGKILGIVGYGNIGSQLSVLAESLGMTVYYYDLAEKLTLGNAIKCASLEELLQVADIVSLHLDGRPENTNLIEASKLKLMKDGAYLINLSRGSIVDLEALREALLEGKLAGAAVDVFPKEPKNNQEPFDSPLIGLENVILTPHVGGSTQEAQESIARFVPLQILNYLQYGETTLSVNFPRLSPPRETHVARFLHVHKNQPGMLAQINAILAAHGINVEGQELRTNEAIGCVLTDTDKPVVSEVLEKLSNIESTLKVRSLG